MSSSLGPSSRGREDGAEGNNETYTRCLKAVKTRTRRSDPDGEGTSSSVEQLVRGGVQGRKGFRKTCSKDHRGTQREGQQDRPEERLHGAPRGGPQREDRPEERLRGGHGRGKQRHRERTETQREDGRGRGDSDSLSSSDSDTLGEEPDLHRGSTGPTPPVNPQSSRPDTRSLSSPPHPPIQTRDLHHFLFSSSTEPDPFWVEVRMEAATRHHRASELGEQEEDEEEEEEEEDGEEGGSGVMDVRGQTVTSAAAAEERRMMVASPCVPVGERRTMDWRTMKREKNRMKSLRRRQRRRERWRQSQIQESRQSSTGNPSSSSSDDEDVNTADKEGFLCAVCLDVYFSPYMCQPCSHVFCEPCLRTLAKNNPTNTPCPLCRTTITHVFFQKELNQTARTFFPKEYLSRKQNFQKASCAKWPLPSCRKLFRIFGGFQRSSSPITRRQFPHGAGYRLDTLDFEDETRGWRFDMDMVIIYIYSVNWVIGFFIFCFLCYLFFPSF